MRVESGERDLIAIRDHVLMFIAMNFND